MDKESFDRLCDNLTRQPARRQAAHRCQRRMAYDMVFSAPKSFSIVEPWATMLSGPASSAFDESILETMAEIEADMQADRRGGADFDRTTGNIAYLLRSYHGATAGGGRAAGYAPAPACAGLQCHLGPGRKSHQGRTIREYQARRRIFHGDVLFTVDRDGRARLQNRPCSRGLKEWEIAGVPQAVIDRFSKRTGEVEEEHAERLNNDPDYRPEYKHELGAKTRSKKQKELTQAELRQEWLGHRATASAKRSPRCIAAKSLPAHA